MLHLRTPPRRQEQVEHLNGHLARSMHEQRADKRVPSRIYRGIVAHTCNVVYRKHIVPPFLGSVTRLLLRGENLPPGVQPRGNARQHLRRDILRQDVTVVVLRTGLALSEELVLQRLLDGTGTHVSMFGIAQIASAPPSIDDFAIELPDRIFNPTLEPNSFSKIFSLLTGKPQIIQ